MTDIFDSHLHKIDVEATQLAAESIDEYFFQFAKKYLAGIGATVGIDRHTPGLVYMAQLLSELNHEGILGVEAPIAFVNHNKSDNAIASEYTARTDDRSKYPKKIHHLMKPDVFLNNSKNYIVEVQSKKIKVKKANVIKENAVAFDNIVQYLALPQDVGEKNVCDLVKQLDLADCIESIFLYPLSIVPFVNGVPASEVVQEIPCSEITEF